MKKLKRYEQKIMTEISGVHRGVALGKNTGTNYKSAEICDKICENLRETKNP
jgi:hypothetical protein